MTSDVFNRAEQTTLDLLVQMKAIAAAGTPVATFNCFAEASEQIGLGVAHAPGPADVGLTKRWERAAHTAGFTTWADIARLVEGSERDGAVVRMADHAHWNRLGHHIAGEALADRLRPIVTGLAHAETQ